MSSTATTFFGHLTDYTLVAGPESCNTDPGTRNTVLAIGPTGEEMRLSFSAGLGDKSAQLMQTLIGQTDIDTAGPEPTSLTIKLGETEYPIEFSANDEEHVIELMFEDASQHTIALPPPPPPPDPKDAGRALLEPVSVAELASVERILSEIWHAIDAGMLTPGQQRQVQAMAELVSSQQRDTIPGVTKRWQLVGVVRALLKYLAKEAPRDALAWWKLIEILEGVGWSTLAGELAL